MHSHHPPPGGWPEKELDLTDFKKLPKGGLKISALIIAITISAKIFLASSQIPHMTGSEAASFMLIFGTFLGLMWLTLDVLLRVNPKEKTSQIFRYLGAYWQRNVIGYGVIYFIGKDDKLQSLVWRRNRRRQPGIDFGCIHRVFYRSLGGWFESDYICSKFIGLNTHSSVPFKIKFDRQDFNAVWVTDDCGNKLQMVIDQAINIVDIIDSTNLCCKINKTYKDLGKLRQKSNDLESERYRLRKLLEAVVIKIWETKRFTKSKGAQGIRMYIESELGALDKAHGRAYESPYQKF